MMDEMVALYQDRIVHLIHRFPYHRHQEGPVELLPYLYIGGYRDADNVKRLKELGITHVLNCAAYRKNSGCPYDDASGVKDYKQFHADDDERYNILQHFPEAREFIDSARSSGGKALVHCAMGINRSGAICAAYIMLDQNKDLIETVKMMKSKRSCVLVNRGFQRQLIRFAHAHNLLRMPSGLS